MTATVTLVFNEATLEISGDYSAGYPGRNYLDNGDPGYPEEYPEFSIDSIKYSGVDVTPVIEAMNNVVCSIVRGLDAPVREDLWSTIEYMCLQELIKD